MLVRIVDTVVATDSVGRPVEAIPVRLAVAGETDITGRPVAVTPAEISALGIPVRIVAGKTAQLSTGVLVDSLPMSGLYEAESLALFARFTTPPTDLRMGQINTLIKALKTAGSWAKLDALYVMAAADSQAATRNWIGDAYNLTLTSAPVFTADRGYQGDGVDDLLNTGFNPSTAGGKFALNSSEIGIWSLTNVAAGNMFDIGNGNSRFNARSTNGDTLRGILNDGTIASLGAAGNSIGHFVFSRTGASARAAYRNGAALGSDAVTSTALSNANIALLSDGGGVNFSTRQQATAHFGSGLTGAEALARYSALNVYLTAVGAV